MVIKERKTADALDKMIRSDPTLTRIMMNGDSQLAECWVDWFTEENFRKVRYICKTIVQTKWDRLFPEITKHNLRFFDGLHLNSIGWTMK